MFKKALDMPKCITLSIRMWLVSVFLSFQTFLYIFLIILYMRLHITGTLSFLVIIFNSLYMSTSIIPIIDVIVFCSCSFVAILKYFLMKFCICIVVMLSLACFSITFIVFCSISCYMFVLFFVH